MNGYCHINGKMYKQELREWADERGFGRFPTEEYAQDRISMVKSFFYENHRFPSQHKEKELHAWLIAYKDPKRVGYCPDFQEWTIQNGYAKDTVSIHIQEIIDFYDKTGKLPSRRQNKTLSARMCQYCRVGGKSYRKWFRDWTIERGYAKISETKQLVLSRLSHEG